MNESRNMSNTASAAMVKNVKSNHPKQQNRTKVGKKVLLKI